MWTYIRAVQNRNGFRATICTCTRALAFVMLIFYKIFSFSDVEVDFPDQLDLSELRGKGLQPGEEQLPEGSGQTQEPGMGSWMTCISYMYMYMYTLGT